MSDVVLATDLHGHSLLEASAGTGKTYALAGLFARAVIVGRLRVSQVLAVTYTIAATQELHARVRARLQAAAELAAHWREGDPDTRAGDKPDIALLRQLLHMALQDAARESLAALRLRLARAVRDMDQAAITTIHGFCQRLLVEHALDAGQALLATELQPDNKASRRALAVALWREFGVGAQGSSFLRRAFGDIRGLADAMVSLLAPEPLLPSMADAAPDVEAAWRQVRAALHADGARFRASIEQATTDRVLSAAKGKAVPTAELWAWFDAQDDAVPGAVPPRLGAITTDGLRDLCLKNKEPKLPDSPLCAAIDAFLRAREASDLQLLHALRDAARERDRAHKQASNVRGFDDLVVAVHDALQQPHARDRLVAALQAQFPLVLVDEFQDTDTRQWAIFAQLSEAGGLVLVGDPKQAIYGFRGGDVHAYLQARHAVGKTSQLDRNFRSRPCVVDTVNRLFARMPSDAMGNGIAVPWIEAGKGHDHDALFDAAPAPALHFHVVPQRPDGKGKLRDHRADESIDVAAALCARAIRDQLQAAADGRATRLGRDGGMRALEPRDCAVLVRRHNEALAVRRHLARLGIPAVATGRQSLFSSEAARELLALLLALAAPGDERRLRAALAMPLFGLDALALHALASDGEQLRHWQSHFEQWRLRWQQHGPQAMLAEVVAERAAAVLALADGERRLTHLLQLGELMQEARAAMGPHGQLDWLRAAIDGADDADEAQWPRLESDASRVQILTLHKSKGLEFPLVFLPFVGIGRGGGNGADIVAYHGADDVRVRQWKTDFGHGTLPWSEAKRRAAGEDAEEDMRLLYVGLTRAIDALWLCGGALASHDKTALHRLLGGNEPDPALCAQLQLVPSRGLSDDEDAARLPAQRSAATPPARVPHRRLQRDWWIHSFSQLHRQRPHGTRALVEDTPAGDERPLAADVDSATIDSAQVDSATADGTTANGTTANGTTANNVRDLRFSGERFGNTLHHALEHVDFAAWRDHAGDAPPTGQDGVLRRALQSQDYREADHDDGVRALVPLLAATLNASLPGTDPGGSFRLCDIPPAQRIAELEFHFTLVDASAAALLALLHAHGIALGRRDFGLWPRLSGLMTGKIDLTCRVDGRVYVLDYKSNYLPGYDADTLQQAMAASEYDLQALLYTVAVHRWLRLRLGDAYDFDTHVGGVRYLFCRGLERDAVPLEGVPVDDGQRGVVVPPLSRALVEAVDALLAPQGGQA